MRKLVFAAALLVISCASKTEKKALDVIADHYGAKTSYSKGFNKNAGEATVKSFSIKVSDSKMIDSLDANIVCANIALMLYENFTPEEKGEYTQIQVDLTQTGKEEANRVFEPSLLDIGVEKSQMFQAFSDNIKNGDYDAVVEMVDPKYMVENLALRLKKYVDQLKDEHGEIVGYKRLGFGEMIYQDGKSPNYDFSGQFEFEDGYRRSYFVLVPETKGDDLVQGYSMSEK